MADADKKSIFSYFVTDDKKSKPNSEDPTLAEASNSSQQSTAVAPLPLNFNYGALAPQAAQPADLSNNFMSQPANAAAEDETAWAAQPPRDEALEQLIRELNDRVRTDAAEAYKVFCARRDKILSVAAGTPLSVILIAASVTPEEMLAEIKVLRSNLEATVAEVEADTAEKVNLEIQSITSGAEEIESRMEANELRIKNLAQELAMLRQQQSDDEKEIAQKRRSSQSLAAQLRVLKQRISLAKRNVESALQLEEQQFRSIPQAKGGDK